MFFKFGAFEFFNRGSSVDEFRLPRTLLCNQRVRSDSAAASFTGLNGMSVMPVGNGSTFVANGSTLVDPSKRQRSKESLSTLVEPVADDLRILNDDLHKVSLPNRELTSEFLFR